MDDFPSTPYSRGKIFAKTGLKVGTNYAKHYLDQLRGKSTDRSSLYKNTAEDMMKEFTRLRGTALKIAQAMSIDQGMLPEEFSSVMSRSQHQVPPIQRALVRSVIKQELGDYPERLFDAFDTKAFAAASIGQVHKAVLKDGRKVAVKIQYPGMRETISTDLGLAKALFKRFVAKGSDINPYFEEIRDTLLMETDYRREGEALDRFHERYESDRFTTPQWIPEYSSDRVLTMTFLEGEHVGDFLERGAGQEERNWYGQLLWDFFHLQVESHAEIHADTHPGNFVLTTDRRLGIIDFGCVKTFPEDFFRDYLMLLPTHLKRDEEEILKLYYRLGVLNSDPGSNEREREYYEFSMNYGFTFAMPYMNDTFDFADPEFHALLKGFTRNVPISNEPRGNRHFLYSTRVHVGLYHLLMKLGAEVSIGQSREKIESVLMEMSKGMPEAQV